MDLIKWMIKNRVAPNLLMALFIFGGFLCSTQIKQEVFPSFDLDLINVVVPYNGASPEEVEKGVVLAIEDAVRGVDGVKKVTSQSQEGFGTVSIELLQGASASKALQDIKNCVDGIQSFPELAERPVVNLLEAKSEVISLMVYGDVDFQTLHQFTEKIRDDLLQLKDITQVELKAVPPMEIGIEVPQNLLLKHHLTLDQIASIVQRTSLEIPAGRVKTASGEILLRTKERRDFAGQFKDIPIISTADGSKIHLGEIASISETYEDTDEKAFFNGSPAIRLNVFRVADQTPNSVSSAVLRYVEEARKRLPKEIHVATWGDHSEMFQERVKLLFNNALTGLILVLLLLGLFLDPRLAFWVTMGIPVSIVGSFMLMALLGISINMISLFAFILTLGIIVDDAIVVGENIFNERENRLSAEEAAIKGTKEIGGPVTFAVLTNMVSFLPLFFIPGATGKFFWQIPTIVLIVFVLSLIESLFILPAHLSHEYSTEGIWKWITKPTVWFNRLLQKVIESWYAPQLKKALEWRYVTFGLGISLLILSASLVIGGLIQFSYLPKIDSDLITAQIVMPFGISEEVSKEVQRKLVDGAKKTFEANGGEKISRGIYTQIGSVIKDFGPDIGPGGSAKGSHLIGAQLFLVPSDQRQISGIEFAKQWRENTGDIPGVDSVKFSGTVGISGSDGIQLELSHPTPEVLEKAAADLAERIKSYGGVKDVNTGISQGKPQLSFRLTPEARSLGITVNDLASQVRSAFYGTEALRQQRGRNEVKVMARLPIEERKKMHTLENLMIRTPQGGEILLGEAAQVVPGRSYTQIRRTEGRRTLTVSADIDETKANANGVASDVIKSVIPELMQKYPGLSYAFAGEQQEQKDSLGVLKMGFIFVLGLIYALLAIPFKSYFQPIIVMMSIPFGIIGAVFGHVLIGYELSMLSMFGIIALAGVVINDSLVFVVTANSYRDEVSDSPYEALVYAGIKRFRPIILTSVTTFFGLAPMIFEKSLQAKFLIPMAISLGFGVLFATVITLLLIPAIYLILEDLKVLILSYKGAKWENLQSVKVD